MESMTDAPVALLRHQYTRQSEQIRERFLNDHDARRALTDLTREVDLVIRQVSSRHINQAEFCAVAIGGYGRGELYPCSDVDLLFLYPYSLGTPARRAIKAALHDLWDLNFDLGHQVWSLKDLKALGLDHLEFVLALLDARAVAGNLVLWQELSEGILPAFLKKYRNKLSEKISRFRKERHRQHEDTIYQLEPDLKQAPGGLRDYLAGKWLLRLHDQHLFLPYSAADVERAHDFLSTLRVFLHIVTRRPQNQLTHRLQEELARQMGFSRSSAKSGVETLMKDYFLNARVLYGFCAKAVEGRNAGSNRGRIDIPSSQILKNAEAVLDVFHESLAKNRPLADSTRQAILNSLSSLSDKSDFPALRPLICDLFKPRPGLYQILTEMYELGVLELLFPEFATIRARVIRDLYHKYTVDEHSLLAIRNIEDLVSTRENSDKPFQGLLTETPDTELLTLSLLLHDVGKSQEEGHVDRGARMAASTLRRFQFPRQDHETILFLIRHHLAMSSVMFRRDLESEDEIRRFVDVIKDPTRLRLLCLMTYADIKAVGPGILNQWKKDLLWQLYVSAYRNLTFGYGQERIEEEDVGEKLLAGLPADLDPERFEQFLEGFPRRYLVTTPAREVYRHYRLASQLKGEYLVQFSLVERGTHHELCVVTPDRYFLFAKIVGLLSYFDMNILRGYGFSNRRNTVLDFFQFDDTRRVFGLNPEEKERFKQLLIQAVRDQLSVERLLERKEKSLVFQTVVSSFPPSVYFEKESPADYTIMEIIAPDSIGLLYWIGREISALRCNIELVLINTEGDKAVDVFYLTRQESRLQPEVQRELERRILRSLETKRGA